jgi:tetratricopeptide (TPR) repeat protein
VKHPAVVQSNAEAERKAEEALKNTEEKASPATGTKSASTAPLREQSGGQAQELYEKGMELGRQNNYAQALDEFNQAIKLDAKNASYYAGRGHSHFMLNQLDNALDDYNKALALNPQDSLPLVMRGHTYLKLGNYDKAIQDYDKAIQTGSTDAEVYIGRGSAYLKLNQPDKMCADFKVACDKGECEQRENARKSGICN